MARIAAEKFLFCVSLKVGVVVILSLTALELVFTGAEHGVVLMKEWNTPYVPKSVNMSEYYNTTVDLPIVYEDSVQTAYFDGILESLFYLIPVGIGFIGVKRRNAMFLTPITVIIFCDSLIGVFSCIFSLFIGVHWLSLIGTFIYSLVIRTYCVIILTSFINENKTVLEIKIINSNKL